MKNTLKISTEDNVVVALQDILKGTKIDGVEIQEQVNFGHKIAIKKIEKGSKVIKYGYPIGITTADVEKGYVVHSHNCKTNLNEDEEYKYEPHLTQLDKLKSANFEGYKRKNGQVGIRNEIWILPTVGCVNDIAKLIEKKTQKYKGNGIDNIVSFHHPYGCSQMGKDQLNTQKILANLAQHPNTAGVLLLGLGCENSGVDEIRKQLNSDRINNLEALVCQDVEDEIEEGILLIEKLIRQVDCRKRESISASELIVGLKCGGSDGLSGITANPLVGKFSDLLIKSGGSTILTEVPEMFGAERILMNRCVTEPVFHKTVSLINDFKQYYVQNNSPIYENPSPGNKKGGITTLEDKSLGCTQKSGTCNVVDVINYGELVKKKGLNLLESPGNDLVATTALAASGSHLVLFTTGRGTPFASPVPTMKISSNAQLKNNKNNWIDFDASELLENQDLSYMGSKLFDHVLRIASGEEVKSEMNGYRDMAIFKTGVTL